MHHCAGLFSVTGAVVEDISVGWIPSEQVGARERTEKQHPALESVRQCHYCRRCPHIADHSKNLVFLIEPLHCFGRSSRLVAVVRRDEPKHPAVHASARVSCPERSLNAEPHILAEFFSRTGECRRNAKPNFIVGYAAEGCLDAARFLPGLLLRLPGRLPNRNRRWLRSRRRYRRRSGSGGNPWGWSGGIAGIIGRRFIRRQ